MKIERLLLMSAAMACISSASLLAQQTPEASRVLPTGEIMVIGHTAAAADVKVPSEVKGQLVEVNVKEGEKVKKGQPLAKLDDAIQSQTVALAREEAESGVEIQAAENQLDFAKNEYERFKNNPAASLSEKREKELSVKQSSLGVDLRKSEQKQNQIKLAREQITLDHMTIRSPIEGSVLRVNKQAGEETDEEPLFEVVDTTKLEAVFFPSAQLFGKVHVGDKVLITPDGAAQPIAATVSTVDPVINSSAGIFRIKCDFDNSDGKVPVGISVSWTWSPR